MNIPTWRRPSAVLLAVVVAMGLSPGTSHAAGGGVAAVIGTVLRYDAVPGDANNVSITAGQDSFSVDDVVAIAVGPGCRHVTPNDRTIVQCAGTINSITVTVSDLDDSVNNLTGTRSSLFGGDGNDGLNGGTGDDTISGDAGNDSVRGLLGNDRLSGGTGNDRMQGHGGDDIMFGGDGDDILGGGRGVDSLDGGSGNNRLDGGAGTDRCVNGPVIVNCP